MNKNLLIPIAVIALAIAAIQGASWYRQNFPGTNALTDNECAAKIGGEIFSDRPDVDYRGCERYKSKP